MTRLCRGDTVLFFFNDTATTEIYTLSLHDALPIYLEEHRRAVADGLGEDLQHVALVVAVDEDAEPAQVVQALLDLADPLREDRKSTRLNSSHANISYAVFCLKKKRISPGAVNSMRS